MSNFSGKSRFPIDAALILRDAGSASLVADTALAVTKLVSNGAYWQDPADVQDGDVYVVGHVEAAVGALVIEIYTAEDAAKTNAKLQMSVPVVANEWFEIPTDQISMKRKHPAATHWYVNVNLTTSASVFVYLAPDVC